MMNAQGVALITAQLYDKFQYLAIGTGEVEDNANNLVNEIDRVHYINSLAYQDYFEYLFTIPSDACNDEVLLEFGLAMADTGNISSTFVNYPIEKNETYEIIVIIYIMVTAG